MLSRRVSAPQDPPTSLPSHEGPPEPHRSVRSPLKRGVDVAGALFGLAVGSPLLAAGALAVRIRHGRPVLFRQSRPGLDGRLFNALKLRTMTNAVDRHGVVLSDAQRLTRLGRWLRASSIDELPQLVNVLRGDMSLVGPRPLLPEYLDRYSCEQARRHEVRPGLTGWAQIHGRNELDWEPRLELDVWYVDHWSHRLDMKIVWRTGGVFVRRRGTSAPGQATMTMFRPHDPSADQVALEASDSHDQTSAAD